MKLCFILFLSTLLSVIPIGKLFSQTKTVKGNIKAAESSEILIGATVFNLNTKQGTTSNTYGFYSLSQKSDSVSIQFSYVGYQPQTFRFLLKNDTTINVSLKSSIDLSEFEVVGNTVEKIHEKTDEQHRRFHGNGEKFTCTVRRTRCDENHTTFARSTIGK